MDTMPADIAEEDLALLYCPEQGGWHTAVFFERRWVDFATMTLELTPTHWLPTLPILIAAGTAREKEHIIPGNGVADGKVRMPPAWQLTSIRSSVLSWCRRTRQFSALSWSSSRCCRSCSYHGAQ
jgi:hypothetical protein